MTKLCFSIISTILFLHICKPLMAQTTTDNRIKGEVIVQLKEDHSVQNLLDYLAAKNQDYQSIEVKKNLSAPFKIWLLAFDEKKIDASIMLTQIDDYPGVALVQYNHRLHYRKTFPDDSFFNKQWQWFNDGSTGGLLDADIDAELVWDYSTGGVTALGDTIVVAVVDDGIDSSHPDLRQNIWLNYHEIPNNGIDDDSNGYVDDYKGWNNYEDNDDIKDGKWGATHGTFVSGIIGADGNNKIGVSGVNWNVKILTVVGGGDESAAVVAYTYLYVVRKQYNESNGKKGAYIVASNSSWGLDYKFAKDAPIWCSMYDSLGKVGILNAGATANRNVNVDVDGDLPTTCPSRYLIAVTNTNKSDYKVTQAAYGPKNIDLGAPGEDVFSTALRSDIPLGYDFNSGTSFSSPMVAGAIGLLYSTASTALLQLAKERPDTVAYLMRKFIFDGVDKNNSLIGKTLTGGRLNIYNALVTMLKWDTTRSVSEFLNQSPVACEFYPNPARGSDFSLKVIAKIEDKLTVSVFDIMGKLISEIPLTVTPGLHNYKLPFNVQASGIYLGIIQNSEGVVIQSCKLLVQP